MAHDGTTKRRGGSKILSFFLLFIIIGLLGAGGFLYKKYRYLPLQLSSLRSQNDDLNKQLAAYKTDPSQAAQSAADKEIDKTISDVGKLYALPKNEKPTLATVKDKEASKKQYGSFFDKAENNDISLFYTKAKIAVLYRPSTNQVINVGSLTIEDKPGTTPSIP